MTKEKFNKYYPAVITGLFILVLAWALMNWNVNKKLRELEELNRESEDAFHKMDSLYKSSRAQKDSILLLFKEAEAFDELSRKKLDEYVQDDYFIFLHGYELIDSSYSKLLRYIESRKTDPSSWDGSRLDRVD